VKGTECHHNKASMMQCYKYHQESSDLTTNQPHQFDDESVFESSMNTVNIRLGI
jgi:hypothetical protein